MPKKPSRPKIARGTDARQMIRALRKAGVANADITVTGNGHLRVLCPDSSIVTLPSDLSEPRTYANNRRELAQHGVSIPSRGGAARGGTRQRPQHHARRTGQITHWDPQATYALVTSDDGMTWFMSRTDMHPDLEDQLGYGQEVSFTGHPVPDLHKQWPQAREVRLPREQSA
jgi:hypothetical protein